MRALIGRNHIQHAAFMLICYIAAHEAAMKELERIFGEAGGHYDTVCEEVRRRQGERIPK